MKCTGIFVFSGMLLWIFSVCVLQNASYAFWTACGRGLGREEFCEAPRRWAHPPFTSRHTAARMRLRTQNGHAVTPKMFTNQPLSLEAGPPFFPCCFFVAEPRLLERDEPRGFGGADTGATVRDRLVCDGELAEVVASHLRLQSDRKHKRQRLASPLSTTWKWKQIASSQIYPCHDDDILARRYISDEGGWVGRWRTLISTVLKTLPL